MSTGKAILSLCEGACPPATLANLPVAWLFSPPDTVAPSRLAVFCPSPVTVAPSPLAVFWLPPPTVADPLLTMFKRLSRRRPLWPRSPRPSARCAPIRRSLLDKAGNQVVGLKAVCATGADKASPHVPIS